MDDKIDTAEKRVLVDFVKVAQKRGMKGAQGDWKEFLNSYDRKFGSSLSDPAKRSHEVLAAFLKTFSQKDDLKIFANIMRRHSNQDMLEQLKSKSHESPEQKLVQTTLQHPLYPLDYSFASLDEEWMVINFKKKSKVMRSTVMVAVDCEMVLCEDGTEAVVKVCVVDRNLEVKLNELVNPNKAITDYRTEITGISAQDLEGVTCSLADIQKSLKKLLSNGAILVGHSLHNDLHVLKLDYIRVIDTSFIFQGLDGPLHWRPSLNNLCKAVLGYEVRKEGTPHNCLDDARAAMKLVLAKIEHGVDNAFPLVQEHIHESAMAKLFLHKIPISVNSQELHKFVPGYFTVELKPSKKVGGENYTALAVFANSQEANDAFENVKGREEKDSLGRPQKLVKFEQSTGITASLYVRKMAPNSSHDLIPSKRAFEADEMVVVSKKTKKDPELEEVAVTGSDAKTGSHQCDTHLNEIEALNQQLKQSELEIESLRQQLKQKDFEISMLNKTISSLKNRMKTT